MKKTETNATDEETQEAIDELLTEGKIEFAGYRNGQPVYVAIDKKRKRGRNRHQRLN